MCSVAEVAAFALKMLNLEVSLGRSLDRGGTPGIPALTGPRYPENWGSTLGERELLDETPIATNLGILI